jgi:hypothetical protein
MSLETGAHREAAHRFYRREGWTDHGTWFVKLLDEPSPPSDPAP